MQIGLMVYHLTPFMDGIGGLEARSASSCL